MIVRFQVDRRSQKLLAKLRRIAREFGGQNQRMQTGYKDCGIVCLNDLRQQFLRKSAGGGEWPPLKEATLKRKKGPGILRETSEMYESLRPGHPNNILRVTRQGVSYGTKDRKAAFHNFGAPRANIPRRRFLTPPPTDVRRRCRAILIKAINDVLTLTAQNFSRAA